MSTPAPSNVTLIRGLGLVAAISINVANMIGTGVFLKARVMTCNVGTPGMVITVWIVAGLLSLAGALTYSELTAMMPQAGGEYIIMREAYGPRWGFLYGWTQFLIARTASAAALAVGFAIFLNDLLGGALNVTYYSINIFGSEIPFGRIQLIALVAIAVTTLINCAAVKFSGGVASFLTFIKIALVFAIGVGAYLYQDGHWSNFALANSGGACEGVSPIGGGLVGFGAAMLGALWAYDGWNNVCFMAGEVKNPGRNLPLALIGGMFIVGALYIFVNISYYYVMTPTEIADVPAASSVAAETAKRFLGPLAVSFMALAMMTSSFGALHTSILSSARIPYAMSRDRLFFERLSRLNPRSHVPVAALVVMGVWSCVLALSGSYDTLTDYAIFALWLFYGLVTASVFIFRQRMPQAERPYRTWGYPVVPILFLLVTTGLIGITIWNTPKQSLIGLALIALGLPIYFYWSRHNRVTYIEPTTDEEER
ncbi:MAG TPA: amino acid permease [Pyrinomonadaceae bacterium]|jgi:APA family basic amino acid/polyamine antiporter